jgi:hypothetical protein
MGIHRETPLNINLNINNERQDCDIGIVWGGTSGKGRVNEGDQGESIWLMDVIYLYDRTKKLFAVALSGARRGLRRREDGGDLTNVQISLI